MKVYIIREKKAINAKGEYDPVTNTLTVLKGSTLSSTISNSRKFRGAKSVEKSRDGVMDGSILTKNITFKSASTAANFVTGSSTNGLITWKNKEGKSLKEILVED